MNFRKPVLLLCAAVILPATVITAALRADDKSQAQDNGAPRESLPPYCSLCEHHHAENAYCPYARGACEPCGPEFARHHHRRAPRCCDYSDTYTPRRHAYYRGHGRHCGSW